MERVVLDSPHHNGYHLSELSEPLFLPLNSTTEKDDCSTS